MEPVSFNLFKEYGLLGLMCAAVIILLFLVIKWVLAFVGDLIKQFNKDRENWIIQAKEERESWRGCVEKQTEALNNHTKRAEQFHESVQEAHRRERDEHEEFMKGQKEQTELLKKLI